jgi:Mn2+/Fe2+ NRAMP family transporter
MKKLLGVTLGILTAVGGFVDIGDLVASSAAGARFGMHLTWVVILGSLGIIVFADMAGRVAAISKRPVFDLVRERCGPSVGLANLGASTFVNFLTLIAEIGGIALALQLASSINYLLWIPLCAFLVWIVIWRVKFGSMETVFGLLGLALVVAAVAVWQLHPDWHTLWQQTSSPHKPSSENWPSYWYWSISLFASAMTPYEVLFFSSGGVEEKWSGQQLNEERANVFVGFPLGMILALSLMALTALVFQPLNIQVDHLSQVSQPIALALGKVGLIVAIVGFFACTFGAALEAGLSSGYAVAQYFGWPWGKGMAPLRAARFHLVVLIGLIAAVVVGLTSVDPVKVTEYSLAFSAVALPLTYLPILLVANDPAYMGDKVNGRFRNALGVLFMVIVVAAAVAAIPLMIWTKGGS